MMRRLAGGDAQDGEQAEAPERHAADAGRKLALIVDVARHHQGEPARHREHAADGKALAASVGAGLREGLVEEHAGPPVLGQRLGLARQVAGKPVAVAVEQEIEAGARGVDARIDRRDEAQRTAGPVLAAQARLLQRQRLRCPARQELVRLPDEIADHQGRRHDEGAHIDDRQAERGGGEKPSQHRHGSCTRTRAPCAAAAARSPCRSWP
jgi:hypothetical protein